MSFDDTPTSICLNREGEIPPDLYSDLRRPGILKPSEEACYVYDLPQFHSRADIEAFGKDAGLRACVQRPSPTTCAVFRERPLPMFAAANTTAHFTDSSFTQPDVSQFRNVSLQRCIFGGSHAGLAHFHNVTWPRGTVFSPGERRIIFDVAEPRLTAASFAYAMIILRHFC